MGELLLLIEPSLNKDQLEMMVTGTGSVVVIVIVTEIMEVEVEVEVVEDLMVVNASSAENLVILLGNALVKGPGVGVEGMVVGKVDIVEAVVVVTMGQIEMLIVLQGGATRMVVVMEILEMIDIIVIVQDHMSESDGDQEAFVNIFYRSMSFEIEEVAVNASTFFFIHTSQCSGLLGLLFGWIIDTSILICNTQHILQTLYVPKC